MAETLTDQFTYVDNGKLILKKSWWDPESGDTYDTFDEVGDAPLDSPQGTVTDPGTLNQVTGQPSFQRDAAAPYAPAFDAGQGRTVGSNQPQSGSYAAPSVPQPQNNPAPGTGAPTQPFNLGGGANQPTGTEYARQSTLYDYANNPGFALQNAMLASGRNPFISGSPMTAMLQRMAPGLGQAFLMQQAGQNLTPNDAARGPQRFQDFLMSALQNNNIPGILSSAAGGLGNAIGSIRDYQGRLAAGESMPNANPYLTELATTLGSGFGQGTTNFLGATLGPFMNRNMLTAYQGNLQNSQMNALRNQVNAPSFNTAQEQDIWRYLLGI